MRLLAVAGALAASPPIKAASSGFAGVSDGLTDLLGDGRMDWRYPSAAPGSLVQTAALAPRATPPPTRTSATRFR